MRDLVRFLVAEYRARGPVFPLARGGGEPVVVLAGVEANRLLGQDGGRFSSRAFFAAFAREMGTDRFLVAMDGAEHRRLRSVIAPAFTPAAVERYLAGMYATARDAARGWPDGVPADGALRRVVADQTALAMTGRPAGDDFVYLSHFLRTALAATVDGTAPPGELHTFDYGLSRARVFALARQVVADHRAGGRTPPGLVHLLLDARGEGGAPLPEEDVLGAVLLPFVAGLDTVGSTCQALLAELLRAPDLRAAVEAEVRAVPGDDAAALAALPLLRACVLETLRLHPVAPAAVRQVVRPFEFAGHALPASARVLFATPVTHFLAELFPEPDRFDPARHLPPREEHRRPGAFVPFSRGPHHCLGAAMAQAQVALTVAAVLRHARLPDAAAHPVAGQGEDAPAAWDSADPAPWMDSADPLDPVAARPSMGPVDTARSPCPVAAGAAVATAEADEGWRGGAAERAADRPLRTPVDAVRADRHPAARPVDAERAGCPVHVSRTAADAARPGLFSPEVRADPYPFYARLREEAPVCWLAEAGAWAVSRYADAWHVLTHPELFSSSILAPADTVLLGADPPLHTRNRARLARVFAPRRVAALEARAQALADELVDGVRAAGGCDLVDRLAAPLPVILIAEMMGIEPERREDFRRWSNDVVAAVTGAPDPARRAAGVRSGGELGAYLQAAVEARRRAPGDDLVSVLVRAEAGDELSAEQVLGFCKLLLIAGNETTTSLIGNAVLALLRHPGVLARLRADPDLAPAVVEEALRYDPPVQMVMRRATCEVELCGRAIPAGAAVLVLLGAANRDPRRFADPDRFDVGRAAAANLALGAGPHFCLGAALARVEARAALRAFATLPAPRLAEACPPPAPSLHHRGPARLRLAWEAA